MLLKHLQVPEALKIQEEKKTVSVEKRVPTCRDSLYQCK